ncbi:MAG TPA: glycosyltransferase family A protein [Anaeromyxobacter sp.]
MTAPAASIVIGVYNRSRQIVPCLESLLASTFQDFEIVLVEDRSSDDSAAVLERFRRDHPERRIEVVHNERNLGACGARNVGIEHARGAWIFFIDSDCIVEPTWLEEMLRATAGGAAGLSGTVRDKPPDSLAERAYVGSCLISRKAPNLMECNMGLRADLAREYRFDDAIAYGGEGDDLSRRLAAGGHAIAFVPAAVVHHHHVMGLRGYMRMAVRLGQGHTRYWYKHDLWVGRDVAPLVLAVATLPLALVDARALAATAALVLAQIAAVLFNEMRFKGKSALEALRVLPVSLLYLVVRTGSVLLTLARIAVAPGEAGIRASKRRWSGARRGGTAARA